MTKVQWQGIEIGIRDFCIMYDMVLNLTIPH
jgi:hypothetical protein